MPICAKVVAMNPTLRMPFKRYEIGKVFRDGPIKMGRFREFTQCDVDIVGVDSQIAEAELMIMALDAFRKLSIINVTVNYRYLMSTKEQSNLWMKLASIHINSIEYSDMDTKIREYLTLISKKIEEIDDAILESKLMFDENEYAKYDTLMYFKSNSYLLYKLNQPINDLHQLVDEYSEYLKEMKKKNNK